MSSKFVVSTSANSKSIDITAKFSDKFWVISVFTDSCVEVAMPDLNFNPAYTLP